MRALRLAAAQFEARPGDVPGNLAAHLAWIEDARREGVDLLLFPELSLTDYQLSFDVLALALAADGPELHELAAAAGDMHVSVGFVEESRGGIFYASQALLCGGRVLSVHRKTALANYGRLADARHFGRGGGPRCVDIGGPWRLATMICADTWNPALPWLAALEGATLFAVPVASAKDAVGDGFENDIGWDVNLRHCALTYGLPVVMANHCGERDGVRFWGGSCILDARGRVLAKAAAEPQLVVAEVSYADVRRARSLLPTVRDADLRLVERRIRRLLDREEA